MTDGLFYDECVKVAAEFPDVNWKSSIVDAFNADVHLHPDRYDIVAMTNLFGDILYNLCSTLAGGLVNAGDNPRHGQRLARLRTGHRRAGQGQSDQRSCLKGYAPRWARAEARA